ncbi:MAG: hypothetical protein V4564_19975 [Pseudomonadota bacterium]
MITLKVDEVGFEEIIRRSFEFLYRPGILPHGTRKSGGSDPRDSSIVSRFTNEDLQLEIGWSNIELSLAILIKYNIPKLSSNKRFVYFEPFIEFITNGEQIPLVPYISEKMSVRNIEDVISMRRSIFAKGLEDVTVQLGYKLQDFLPRVESSSADEILAYHDWISSIV